jgi:hypothetical protein
MGAEKSTLLRRSKLEISVLVRRRECAGMGAAPLEETVFVSSSAGFVVGGISGAGFSTAVPGFCFVSRTEGLGTIGTSSLIGVCGRAREGGGETPGSEIGLLSLRKTDGGDLFILLVLGERALNSSGAGELLLLLEDDREAGV